MSHNEPFEPITKSLRPSVQKFQSEQAQVMKNRQLWLFWPIWQLPVGCFWPKWSKDTSTDLAWIALSVADIRKGLFRATTDQDFFIGAFNEVSMTLRSKVLARTKKVWRTDRQTDGHPKPIGPNLLGWCLKTRSTKMVKIWLYRSTPKAPNWLRLTGLIYTTLLL